MRVSVSIYELILHRQTDRQTQTQTHTHTQINRSFLYTYSVFKAILTITRFQISVDQSQWSLLMQIMHATGNL